MNTRLNYIHKIKNNVVLAWFITAILLLMGANMIKEILIFILTWLYEIFIQQKYI